MVTPSGSLWSSTARKSSTPSWPDTRKPLAIATPSKKVCSVRPSSAETPGRRAQPVRLLAEVEVRGQDVLGQVNGEIPEQHVDRRAGRVAQHLGQHAQDRDREHEPGAERRGTPR